MAIDSGRLTELRNRKRWSQAKLGERAGITARQIARLESEAGSRSKPRDRTIEQLAKALDVEPGVLTGDLPMHPADDESARNAVFSFRKTTATVGHKADLAFALIKWRYGVSFNTLVNVAPLMFVLLAESSFSWRRKNLQQISDATESLRNLGFGYKQYACSLSNVDWGIGIESESIENRDLFGKKTEEGGENWLHTGHNPGECNPFADYLRHLSETADNEGVISLPPDSMALFLEGFPDFNICSDDLIGVTCGCPRLEHAVDLGLRINRMPERLLGEEATEERKEWLEQQIEEQFTTSDKKLLDMRLELAPVIAEAMETDE